MNEDTQTHATTPASHNSSEFFLLPKTQDQIKASWAEHVLNRRPFTAPEPYLRDTIRRSWERSAAYGLSPESTQDTQVPFERYHQIWEENDLLIRVAFPILEKFYQYLRSSNYVLQLCSKDACVLKSLCDDARIESLSNRVSSQKEGYYVSERVLGTNSTALCLQERRPFEVFGAEHYQRRTHPLICSSAPIFDEAKNLLGCITLVCPLEYYQKYTRAVLVMATDSISKEFQLRKTNRLLISTNSKLAATIKSQRNGLILLDEQRNILYHNDRAVQLLNYPGGGLYGRTLDQVLPPQHLPQEMQTFTSSVRNLRIDAVNSLGKPVNIVADLTIDHHPRGTTDIVLSIERQKDVYERTNLYTGAYATYTFDSLQGRSAELLKSIELGKLAAQSDSNVLILGESGTGKEILAQAIHNFSDRANGPFLAINCASLPRNLIESELFGYERGAFTGANKEGNPGKFELANGGTIFLDEIGDMPLDLQATLLRVLQEHTTTRLGGMTPIPIDARIISASNRDLSEEVRQHRFREDLYYRLNVLPITLPPLRSRMGDVAVLAEHFVSVYSDRLQKKVLSIAPDAMQLLNQFPWPGNVRELENAIERAVNFVTGPLITAADLPQKITAYRPEQDPQAFASPGTAFEYTGAKSSSVFSPPQPDAASEDTPKARSPEISEYQTIVDLLTREKGHVRSVAADMGIPVSTLYGKLRKYNLDPKDYRTW